MFYLFSKVREKFKSTPYERGFVIEIFNYSQLYGALWYLTLPGFLFW